MQKYACMYVCMHVCMYACMHACMYIYIHIHTHIYIDMYVYVRTHTCICLSIWIYPLDGVASFCSLAPLALQEMAASPLESSWAIEAGSLVFGV